MEEPGDTIVVAAWPIVGYQLIVINKYQFSLWTVATLLLTPRYSKYKNMHHPNLKKCDQDFCEMVLKVFSMRDLKAWLIADDVEVAQGTGRPLFSGRRVAAIF